MTGPSRGHKVSPALWARGSPGRSTSCDGARGELNEHLDCIVRHPADRMVVRIYGFPRGRRIDTSAADFRRDFADLALCFWQTGGLRASAHDEERVRCCTSFLCRAARRFETKLQEIP